jgi:hypothetical protein
MADEATAKDAGLAGDTKGAGSPVVTPKPKPLKPSLEFVLAKEARGETLTPQECGVKGAAKRKAKALVAATAAGQGDLLSATPTHQPGPAVVPKPAPAALADGEDPLAETHRLADVPADAVGDSEFSSERCLLAAEAICDAVDGGTQMFISYKAECAGGDRQTCAKYESAVALQPRNRKLMVEGSEPVIRFLCRFFKCTPEKLPDAIKSCGFAAGIIAHGLTVAAAVRSINQSIQQKSQPQPQPKPE